MKKGEKKRKGKQLKIEGKIRKNNKSEHKERNI